MIGIFGYDERRLKRPQDLSHLTEDLYKLCGYITAAPAQDLLESLLSLNSYDLRTVRRCIDVFKASTVASIAGESARQPARLLKLPHSGSSEPERNQIKNRPASLELVAKMEGFKLKAMGTPHTVVI